METKICSKCSLEKHIDDFSWKSRTHQIRQTRCKLCLIKYAAEYREKNRDIINKKMKCYYKENRAFMQERQRNYYRYNKTNVKKYQCQYNSNPTNKRKRKKYNIEYYKKKRNEILNQKKTYQKECAKEIAMRQKAYFVKNRNILYQKRNIRMNNDINFRLADRLRSRLRHALKSDCKMGSAVKDLGCSIPELKLHLEKQFKDGMSWNNYGYYGWHIDHIKPLSSFDLTNREEFLKACHYTNLQPLWWIDNLRKSDNVELN